MASEIFFSTNQADWEALEGLYVSERKPAGFIKGVNLSAVGMATACVKGPPKVVKITNPSRFSDVFGERDYYDGGTAVGEGWKALLNKKFGTLYIRRVIASDAVLATKNLLASSTPIIQVDASSKGQWPNPSGGTGVLLSVEDATNGEATQFNLRVKYRGKVVVYENLNTNGSGDNNLASVVGEDDANLVVLTKLANGRPDNVADATMASGADGTVTEQNYEDAMDEIAATAGIGVCLTPEAPPTIEDFNNHLCELAADAVDRVFLTWAGVHDNSEADEVSQKENDITTTSDRIVWCYNSPKTKDTKSGAKFSQGPHVWMASILSQVDADVHPGSHDTQPLLAGVTEVAFPGISRGDLVDLRAAGISTLEQLPSSEGGGFIFRSAVTTKIESGFTELVDRRMKDFLILSAAFRLRFYVKSKNTRTVRGAMRGELFAFSKGLQDAERFIDADSEDNGPGFVIAQKTVNTTSNRGRGIEKILWRVRLMGHILYLVLEVDMSTGLVVEAAA